MNFNIRYRCTCGMFAIFYCSLAASFIRFKIFNIFEYMRKLNNKILQGCLFVVFIMVQTEIFDRLIKKYEISDEMITRIYITVYSSSIIVIIACFIL